MGAAFETVFAYDTDNVAVTTDIAAVTGSSLVVKATRGDAPVSLVDGMAHGDGEINFRVRSANLHDFVRGIEFIAPGAQINVFWPRGVRQRLIPQDTISVTGFSAGAAADIGVALTFYYADLPGADQRLISPDEVARRGVHVLGLQQDLPANTLGTLSGEQAINADTDPFKANTDYALIGAVGDAGALSVNVRGPDTSNLRIGIPVISASQHYSSNYLLERSRALGVPAVPVINSANKSATLVDLFHPVALTLQATLILVQLA